MVEHGDLLERIRGIIAGSGSAAERLQVICENLREALSGYDWVGIYMVDPERERELILGPYAGAPTEHDRIPFGQGICGQAAQGEATFKVDDVSQESNYLACSTDVKSEIVVPVFDQAGQLIAVFDVDSDQYDAFDEIDQRYLEQILSQLARFHPAPIVSIQ